jgi:hypothetical protein
VSLIISSLAFSPQLLAWRGECVGYRSIVKEGVVSAPVEEETTEQPKVDVPTPAPPVETPEPEQEPVKAPETPKEKGGICGPTGVVLVALVFARTMRKVKL